MTRMDVVCAAWFADVKLELLPDEFTIEIARAIWPTIDKRDGWAGWWVDKRRGDPWHEAVTRLWAGVA